MIALCDLPREIHNVYIVFSMDYIGGEPQADGVEVDGAGFFSWEEMQEMNVAPLTTWIVNGALHNKSSNGLVIDQKADCTARQVWIVSFRLRKLPYKQSNCNCS
ncbi:hypothetical protein GCM10020331_075010 [Ectobacillus funiculus]